MRRKRRGPRQWPIPARKLAELLSRQSDTLIMTSATPHDGKPASFASSWKHAQPHGHRHPERLRQGRHQGLCSVRRFKKDIQDQIAGGGMKDAAETAKLYRYALALRRARLIELLAGLKFPELLTAGSVPASFLFRTVLEKASFSSPAASLPPDRNRPPEEAGNRRFARSRARSRGTSGTGHGGRSHHGRRFHQVPEATQAASLGALSPRFVPYEQQAPKRGIFDSFINDQDE